MRCVTSVLAFELSQWKLVFRLVFLSVGDAWPRVISSHHPSVQSLLPESRLRKTSSTQKEYKAITTLNHFQAARRSSTTQ